ncbi:hypothetical protein FRAAL4444 [Frankia alni ACN14a]|uniref:Uncharacterized protein n=1 Tax=Frankia alni (strain DSM 45986 / CECT 9034 / ACN14a) TaxID=326424 RepID=Q0RHE3_FRAAA|nr:hypothetical protein FRAAL4444 [Frankia alni ACN14a]
MLEASAPQRLGWEQVPLDSQRLAPDDDRTAYWDDRPPLGWPPTRPAEPPRRRTGLRGRRRSG